MTPEQWQQVEEVLQAALDRPSHERAAFLNEVCAGDEQLKQEAASLAEAHDEAGDFIEESALALDAQVFLSYTESNIGREIGPYRILECLGEGGMGQVYLAKDERLDRFVALKILPDYFVSDDARLHRFQKEARAASALNHPNILTIHEVGEAGGLRFIATEFIEGRTIRELIANKDLQLDEVLNIAVQVCVALSAAHAAGIVHRDIKPENIMRRPDGIVKILDFGIAKLMESSQSSNATAGIATTQTETGIVIGTVGYMSPEQARGLPVDERTDVWSLGVVLYEMLTRHMPFSRATRMDTMVAILERQPQPLFQFEEKAPAELKQLQRIINKALSKETDERYQTATEFLAELRTISKELEVANESTRQEISEVLRAPGEFQQSPSRTFKPGLAPFVNRRKVGKSGDPAVSRYVLLLGAVVLVSVAIAGSVLYRHWLKSSAQQTPVGPAKPYSQMSDEERLTFIGNQGQRISTMMGDRPVKLKEDAVRSIKRYVDRYAARTNSTSDQPSEEALRVIYSRPGPYLPTIARSFAARNVPVIIGIYLPMIESEYRDCYVNKLGAKGIFQFLPQTAEQYGVARSDMCDVEKMTPAAAHYIADRMAELGDDSQSLTLVILSFNRGPEWVRDTLRELREAGYYDRNFWTLFDNRGRLDNVFRDENAGYVPMFFAAAIVGENPQNFELHGPALSTLAAASLKAN